MCPGVQKVRCRLPSPQGTPKTSAPFPAQHPHRARPHPSPSECPQKSVPGGPLAGPPSQLLPPGRCQRGPPGSSGVLGSPGASGTELRAAGKKNPRHELCREKERRERGGPQSIVGGWRGDPPKNIPREGREPPSAPALGPRVPRHPRGALPPQRSPLWSGAGPFRVSSDISRDGIQGMEPRG